MGYLTRVRELLTGTYVWAEAVDTPPPGARLHPTIDEVELYLSVVKSAAVDIENAGPHLVMVGLWGRGDYARHGGLTLRFITDGAPHPWSWTEWHRLVRALARWLADPGVRKSAHNGQSFDWWLLEWLGFRVAGYDCDTLLMSHIADPESKKDLGTLGVGLAGLAPWKSLAKGEIEGGEQK